MKIIDWLMEHGEFIIGTLFVLMLMAMVVLIWGIVIAGVMVLFT